MSSGFSVVPPDRLARYNILAGMMSLLLLFFLLSCSGTRKASTAKTLRYSLAPRAERLHVFAETRFILQNYGFNIESGSIEGNYEALRSDWRMRTQNFITEAGAEMTLEVRDRATLHLSPRGLQSTASAQVTSTLEFKMQTPSADKKKWIDIAPDQDFQEEYKTIVYDIQNRLRRLGYQFN